MKLYRDIGLLISNGVHLKHAWCKVKGTRRIPFEFPLVESLFELTVSFGVSLIFWVIIPVCDGLALKLSFSDRFFLFLNTNLMLISCVAGMDAFCWNDKCRTF